MALSNDKDDTTLTELQSLSSNPESQNASLEANTSKISELDEDRKVRFVLPYIMLRIESH